MINVLKFFFFLLYFTGLVYVVFFARRRQGMHLLKREQLINKTPVINKVYEYKHMGNDKREKVNFFTNLVGNVLLFVPFPMMIMSLFKISNDKLIMVIAFTASLCIEILQYVFKSGVADIDDLLLNTVGAFLGLFIAKIILKYFHHRA